MTVAGQVIVSLASASLGTEDAERWIKITPRGEVTTRPGDTYSFDPEALAARFEADDVRLPIDFDHAIARLASKGHTTPAVGWIEAVEARPDGLYGRVEWLKSGLEALSSKTHRYISPTFHHEKGKAIWLHSVALVTAPALSRMPALADAAASDMEEGIEKSPHVRASLSLSADATDAQVLTAIAELKAKASAVSETMEAPVQQLLVDLAAARTEVRTERVKEKVEVAIKEGSLPPYMRDWALVSCGADEAGFDELIKHVGTPLAYLTTPNPTLAQLSARNHRSRERVSAEAQMIASQLGISRKSLDQGDE